MTTLQAFVAEELATAAVPQAVAAAQHLAGAPGAAAVLFYGSVLRTGDLDGVLDFYVLTAGKPRGVIGRVLWPDVAYHEIPLPGRVIRAKAATMPLSTFAAAARGDLLDTTIWARFVQPSALLWCADDTTHLAVTSAIAAAMTTAARYAAAFGPSEAAPLDYWRALFAETYRTELRVERPGREHQILSFDPARYAKLLPLAWNAAGIAFDTTREAVRPHLLETQRRRLKRAWRARRRAGKPLNLARLAKAAFTFDGAARYGLWKLERHTGVHVPLTPWRERHPILAAPGVMWRVWRAAPRS
ncbi:hypothetical protein EAH87_15800 [Sphingomonas koreensis]|nr:hypothetical protein EAH87_15800 [Sphingomonas koreensis]